jgi:NAD(P)H-flavin reductase/ferredoxin/truncated hemoglobin YjbI
VPRLRYENEWYDCRAGESVIDAFLRQGVVIPFSCRNGICHTCLQRCVGGEVPEQAQVGLRPTLRTRGYFLPCKCVPTTDMEIAPPREADLYAPAVVYRKEQVAPDICRVLIEPATSLYYHAGQFINVRRADGLIRSYSLASAPQQDYFLELHVKRVPDGTMSTWIFDELAVNDEIEIQGPQGSCYYAPSAKNQPMLLVATGTGLAPLYGVVRDALLNGHTGPIHLYHGVRDASRLYLHDPLSALLAAHRNLRYVPCVSGPDVPPFAMAGRADTIAFQSHDGLSNWAVYLAGLPAMVHDAAGRARKAGVAEAALHVDPFESATRPILGESESHGGERKRDHAPDPEMWAGLGQGERLKNILVDFYTHVYADPRLAPFFHGITMQRSIEKQYLFLRQIFTGEKVYLGDRPRNAHHWMVISDELFDYREELLMECARHHGLAEHLVRRWRAMENGFRSEIVKSAPWKRVLDGVELPVDGFGETRIDVGSLCDSCGGEVAPGEKVRYHVRLGSIHCARCHSPESARNDGDEARD